MNLSSALNIIPAITLDPSVPAERPVPAKSRVCEFCAAGEGSYTCPRCNKDYCGLACYQSIKHSRCSEDFYKECVKAELVGDELSAESRTRMQQILQRMAAGEQEEDEEEVDSDDDEEETELSARLAGVDLEDPEAVWSRLSASERREFTELLEGGEVGSLLPAYTPWWGRGRQDTPRIQDLDAPVDEGFKEGCPRVWEEIPRFGDICRQKPSQYIQFGVLNLLYAYAYAVRFHYGDYSSTPLEFLEVVELLAGCLRGENYSLADTAVEAAASTVNLHTHIAVSLEFSRSVKKDVYDLVRGPGDLNQNYYILAGLSDLREQYRAALKFLRKPAARPPLPTSRFAHRVPDLDPKVLKVHLKKVEFYLSWALEHAAVFKDM